jgi:hypothetical protein
MHTSEGALTIATSSLMLLKSCPPTIRTASSIALHIALTDDLTGICYKL